uniref:Uncharacterized protein n=1 Tax=Helicotheca tamesis TaxID=374047 RepID=A0A7S2IBA6_9STRA|mmetsp:Transcript_7590/g.10324  ORF Transcript_7590/g.10324 Transcript_7590/m.10324 type:complete len:251 (+) Transcript_7590:71-823(+)
MILGLFSAPQGRKKAVNSRQLSVEIRQEEECPCSPKEMAKSEPPAGIDPGVMESILQKKDERISSQQEAITEKDNEILMLRQHLGDMCLKQSENSFRHKLEVGELERQKKIMITRLSTLARDLHDNEALHQYAVLVREAAPSKIDSSNESSYVEKVQSQLCKALHQVGAWGNQLSVLKTSCEEAVSSLQKEIVELEKEITKAEIEHMNAIKEKERENKDMRNEYESMLKIQQETIAKLEKELENERSQKE